MKLVVYYSRTGFTKKIALEIKKKIKADSEEIIDTTDRKGIFGYLKGGKDALKKSKTKIIFSKDPSIYSQVIIGTPVWVGTMAPAIRQYLNENNLKNVAFFCTAGGGNNSHTFKDMQSLSNKPKATLELKTRDVNENIYQEKLNEFIKKIK